MSGDSAQLDKIEMMLYECRAMLFALLEAGDDHQDLLDQIRESGD